MPPTNVIINGDFSNGGANWSGIDLEFNPEGAFLENGSSNTVTEIDGNRAAPGQPPLRTVLEQSFTLDDSSSALLTFDTALRNASSPAAGEGFLVEVLDSNGVAIASMTQLPTANSFSNISISVDFPSAGDYTLRFSELGPDDSLGAIVDNISLIVCFCDGTLIRTDHGDQPVEKLRIGDRILTQSGYKPLKWIGRRRLNAGDLAAQPKLCPVRISKGALGDGQPTADLWVSRQHRMQTQSTVAQRMFGKREVLISAIRLTALPGIKVDPSVAETTYYHLLFEEHEIVFANGAPSESMLLSETALSALTPSAREELHALFPGLTAVSRDESTLVIPNSKRQNRLVERLSRNRKPLIEHTPVQI